MRDEKWTFNEFLEMCVIHEYESGEVYKMNFHWRPQYVLGAFCFINYSFIGMSLYRHSYNF